MERKIKYRQIAAFHRRKVRFVCIVLLLAKQTVFFFANFILKGC